MKIFGKLVLGALSLGVIAGGAYCYLKNKAKKDEMDFDDFDDDFDDDFNDDFDDFDDNLDSEEEGSYVSLNMDGVQEDMTEDTAKDLVEKASDDE